jgi:hypothetical protein
MRPPELAQRLRGWLHQRPGLFGLQDLPDGVLLTELATGKSLRLAAEAVVGVEVQRDRLRDDDYLLLTLAERPSLALAAAGFVFALDPRHTGKLPSAPPAMSFTDYHRLVRHLLHLLDTQDDPEHRREALDITLVLIASLDGARAVGLAVDGEEAALEAAIRRLEAGG